MNHHVRVRPAAEQDIWTAVGWYDANAPGHSDRLREVSAAMARLAKTPNLCRTVHGA